MSTKQTLPFLKSVPGGILLSFFLGPIGMLYATLWGGIIMTLIGLLITPFGYPVPILLWWLLCPILSVFSIERHNRKERRAHEQSH